MSQWKFEKGDDYKDPDSLPTAGIHVREDSHSLANPVFKNSNLHGNRIEVYGKTAEEAANLRDFVLERLTAKPSNVVQELVSAVSEFLKWSKSTPSDDPEVYCVYVFKVQQLGDAFDAYMLAQ